MDIDQLYRENIERKILETIATALEKNLLNQEELPNIANFVLERIDGLKTREELISFLSELSSKWLFFKNLEELEKGEEKEEKEKESLKNVLELAKNGSIDEAVALAKDSTGNN